MKLPAIQEGAVQSLGRQDIYGPIREARSLSGAALSLAKVAQDIGGRYLDIERQKDLQDASLYASEQSLLWKEQNETREYYSGDEMTDSVVEDRTSMITDGKGNISSQVRQDIPAYAVQPDLYKDFMTGAIQVSASKIRNTRDREQFLARMNASLSETYGKMRVESAFKQKEHIRTRQEMQINDAIQRKQYDIARALTENYLGTKEEARKIRNQINRSEEIGSYSEIVIDAQVARTPFDIQESVKEIDRALGILSDQENYTGTLNTEEREAEVNKLRAARNMLESRLGSGNRQQEVDLKYDVDQVIKAMENGERDIPAQYIMALGDQIAPLDRRRYRQLQQAARYYAEFVNYNTLSPSEQALAINDLQKSVNQLSGPARIEAANRLRRLRGVANDHAQSLRTDALSRGVQTGIITIEPINYQNIADSLIQRKKAVDIVRREYDSFTGYLTQSEAVEFSDRVETMTDAQKLALANSVHVALGDSAPEFYEQLKVEGLTSTFTIAGQAMAEGDRVAARTILRGSTLLSLPENRNILKNASEDLTDHLNTLFGNAYAGNPTQRSLMWDATRAAYAQLAVESGEYGEEFDSKLADRAFAMATGGLIEINGSTIEPPIRNMSQNDFERYIDNVSPSVMSIMAERQGGILGWSPQQLLTAIQEGEVKLISNGKNDYALYNSAQDGFVRNKQGGYFVFSYVPDARTVREDRLEAAAGIKIKPGSEEERRYRTPEIEEQKRLRQERAEKRGKILDRIKRAFSEYEGVGRITPEEEQRGRMEFPAVPPTRQQRESQPSIPQF